MSYLRKNFPQPQSEKEEAAEPRVHVPSRSDISGRLDEADLQGGSLARDEREEEEPVTGR